MRAACDHTQMHRVAAQSCVRTAALATEESAIESEYGMGSGDHESGAAWGVVPPQRAAPLPPKGVGRCAHGTFDAASRSRLQGRAAALTAMREEGHV